ncbi:MAG TPA: hypothetical protein PKY59_17180 [Pyrinomonadaceae bacterium]|nr:hypothetical protein [Pyrinomonadaceae bacterium]
MDVFQKVLLKIYELTGGKDTIDVDLAELLKKEGFYPSLPSILEQLSSQSWITVTARKNIVRITHWGVAEAKKVSASPSAAVSSIAKDANRLLSESRELVRILEDFVQERSAENFSKVENKAVEVNEVIAVIKANL